MEHEVGTRERPLSENDEDRNAWRSALPWAIASLVCSYASAFMQWLYGYYHWQVVFAYPRWEAPPHVRGPLFAMFDIIHFHKILFAVGATILAIACMRHRPRWIAATVLVPAVLLLFLGVCLMT